MTYSSTHPQYLNSDFDDFCEGLLKQWNIPGVSMAVVDGDDIYTKAYGVSRPGGPKVTEDTLFNAASMSKSFTASAVALVIDDEKYPNVKWDTPVSEVMREDFVLSDPYYTQNVTIKDMLSHRTGMAGHNDVTLGIDAKIPSTPQSVTRSLRDLPISRPLRTTFQYQNLMYTAASYLVEVVTGQSFAEVLKTRFWQPLGMDRTYLATSRIPESVLKDPANKMDAAIGCYWDKEAQSYTELLDTVAPEGQGAGNILSSAKDWGRWVHANIHGTHAVSKESLSDMTRPVMLAMDIEEITPPFRSPFFYGMGWMIEWYRGYKVVSHTGSVPGFSSIQFWLPQKKWGGVIFGNSDGMSPASGAIMWTLIDKVLHIPKDQRTDWIEWSRKMDDFFNGRGNDANGQETSFPDRASPPLPLPLPLPAYAGLYKHPAYHEFMLETKDNNTLVADAPDRTFGFTLTFEHVSSNFFVARRRDSHKSSDMGTKLEAEFEVGVSGQVKRLGIDFMQHHAGDYIWFTRAD